MIAIRTSTALMLLALLTAGCRDLEDGQATGGTSKLGLADVSVLFPLPKDAAATGLMGLDAAGRGGPLLGAAQFAQVGILREGDDAQAVYRGFRVVAARIDPCFPDVALLKSNPSACRRQLRLVAQPLVFDASVGTTVFDDALHLAYELPESEFEAFARAWVAVRTSRSSDLARPLDVHVEVQAQGLEGPVASELRRLILAHAGPQALRRVTFMQGSFARWTFGGVELQDGEVSAAVAIHGLAADAGTQSTVVPPSGVFEFAPGTEDGRVLEALAGEGTDGALFGAIDPDVTLTASPEALREAMQRSLDIDHPSKRNPDTVDCSACHVAGRARERGKKEGLSVEGLERFEAKGFNLSIDGLGRIKARPQEQRAFGYHLQEPVWNRRTVNESAAVAQALSDLLFGDAPGHAARRGTPTPGAAAPIRGSATIRGRRRARRFNPRARRGRAWT